MKNSNTSKTVYLGLASLALVLVVAGVVVSASAHYSNPKAQEALVKRDFGAYKTAILEGAKDHTKKVESMTQADFDKMADNKAKMDVIKPVLEQAIKDNNYEAFKIAQDQVKSIREERKDEKNDGRPARVEPTEEQKKAMFDQAVAQYKKDGSLGHFGMKKEGRGENGEHGNNGGRGGKGLRDSK
jgi:hypothetical protein